MRKLIVLAVAFLIAFAFVATPAWAVAPTVTSFTPTSGVVGIEVAITGTDFTGTTGVDFNGVAATSFTEDSDLQVRATVPVGASTGPITVTNADGPGTSTTDFTVLPPAPTITSFTPTAGKTGIDVTITGTDFTGATSVTFAGQAASFTVNSPTEIVATVPGGAVSGPISVTTPGGTFQSVQSFTVRFPPRISGFSPRRGPVSTRILITGAHFDFVSKVLIGKMRMKFTRLSSTRIRAKVPLKAKSARITVRARFGSDRSGSAFLVRKNQHRSSIALKLSGHLSASGSVRATDGARVCKPQRLVAIQRRSGGSWHTVRRVRTLSRGGYHISLPDNEGAYRAVVAKKSSPRDICRGATSNTVKHHHASGGGGGGGSHCDPAYPTVCIPSPPPDLDCSDIPYTNFRVNAPDPHGFDSDHDHIGCET